MYQVHCVVCMKNVSACKRERAMCLCENASVFEYDRSEVSPTTHTLHTLHPLLHLWEVRAGVELYLVTKGCTTSLILFAPLLTSFPFKPCTRSRSQILLWGPNPLAHHPYAP